MLPIPEVEEAEADTLEVFPFKAVVDMDMVVHHMFQVVQMI